MARTLRAQDLAQRFPVTLALGVVTAAFFALQHWLADGMDPLVHLRLGALRVERVSEHGEYFRLLMPLFIHAGWVHLLLNGLAFVQLAALVELLWGGRRLLLFYVVCGLGGSLTSAVLNGPEMGYSVGASGAILGLAGVVLGTTWFGTPTVRGWLLELVGRRLLYGVFLTFAIGFGLWLVLPRVDNWAHLGGLITGLLLAAATADPAEEEPRQSLAAASAAGAALVASIGWMALHGDRCLQTAELDLARDQATALSERPGGGLYQQGLLLGMVDWYARAGADEEGLEALRRAVGKIDQVQSLLQLAAGFEVMAEGDDRDEALFVVCERALQLAPDDPDVLNLMAWRLVQSRESLRDPARAEELSRASLDRLGDDDDRRRSAYLDTLGEALFQLGDYRQAEEVQIQSVQLAEEIHADYWPVSSFIDVVSLDEMSERLEKIRRAAARG
ncbi:MAG: rhomboid family intramembrane serine protease [Myxococcales bacterium]|nr:rhomboid family intramembrane serine protease [Myxococcales bacterium]